MDELDDPGEVAARCDRESRDDAPEEDLFADGADAAAPAVLDVDLFADLWPEDA
ncbi:MAG: hypothetical protein IPM64_06240 [Phycisphaerales bacterium]|nr:hypothetical protein [Phycisphaerales bacterium]